MTAGDEQMSVDPIHAWRPMTVEDIGKVKAISDAVHGAYTEGADVYAERLRLYPAGCRVLERAGDLHGYLLSHPWLGDQPPALDKPIGILPIDADCYYLHDLALLPSARGTGAAAQAIASVVAQARAHAFPLITLIAVNGAERFWRKHGFVPSAAQSAGYGDGAISMERHLTS